MTSRTSRGQVGRPGAPGPAVTVKQVYASSTMPLSYGGCAYAANAILPLAVNITACNGMNRVGTTGFQSLIPIAPYSATATVQVASATSGSTLVFRNSNGLIPGSVFPGVSVPTTGGTVVLDSIIPQVPQGTTISVGVGSGSVTVATTTAGHIGSLKLTSQQFY